MQQQYLTPVPQGDKIPEPGGYPKAVIYLTSGESACGYSPQSQHFLTLR